jgi:hypothetical protein
VTESAQTSSSEHYGIVITQELGSPGVLGASGPSHLPEGDRVPPNRMAKGNHRGLIATDLHEVHVNRQNIRNDIRLHATALVGRRTTLCSGGELPMYETG